MPTVDQSSGVSILASLRAARRADPSYQEVKKDVIAQLEDEARAGNLAEFEFDGTPAMSLALAKDFEKEGFETYIVTYSDEVAYATFIKDGFDPNDIAGCKIKEPASNA